MLHRATNRWTGGRLELIAKDVVPHAPIVAAPSDEARPRKRAPKGPLVEGAPLARSRHCSRDDARKRAQETLQGLAPFHANEQMHMRTDVGKIVDANAVARGASARGFTHQAFVPAQRPRATRPLAMEREVGMSRR